MLAGPQARPTEFMNPLTMTMRSLGYCRLTYATLSLQPLADVVADALRGGRAEVR